MKYIPVPYKVKKLINYIPVPYKVLKETDEIYTSSL